MSKYFKISCTNCNKTLKVSEDLAGKNRVCPYCHTAIRIPKPTQTAPDENAFPNLDVSSSTTSSTPTPSPPRRRKRAWYSAGSGESASSDVSLSISCMMGAVMCVVWLAMMFPLRQYQFGQLFWNRGWVPFATTFLMFWSVGILILKWLNLKQQRESMLLDLLPTEVSKEITLKSLDPFVEHINQLPTSAGESFLTNRVLRGIEHFRVRKSAAEVVTMMESQSAIDANNVAGSYTLLKAFIWALPILGFIGTVIGVSAAVASLAGSLESASDMTSMKGALNSVFAGLGTAFDTTLLALIMSMFVKIPTSALQKSEDDLITSVDEYCNENLLRRLNDGREGGAERGAGGGGGANVDVFREAVEAAMGTHHAELENWLKKLDAIGGKLTSEVSDGWEKINARIQKQQSQHAQAMQKQQMEQQEQLQAQLNQMASAAEKIQQTLGIVAESTSTMQNDVNGSFAEAQQVLQQRFAGLEKGLNSLSSVLEKLGEQSIVVQQVQPKNSWNWFSKPKKKYG